jgi:hypothetical protein
VNTCSHCGASNKPDSRFCGECGQPLGVPGGVTCPMCDTPNPPAVTVCTNCGAQLLPPGLSHLDVPLVAEGPGGEVTAPGTEAEAPTEPAGGLAEEVDTVTEGPAERVGEQPGPPWLKKLEAEPDEEAPLKPEEGEFPEWLEVPPDFEQMLAEAAVAAEEEEVAPGEIPSWLHALRPEGEEGVGGTPESMGPAETTGLLKGIRGTLGIEPVVAIPRRATPVPTLVASGVSQERAEIFGALAREPARVGAEVTGPRRVEGLMASTGRWIMYLILMAGVAIPILWGGRWVEADLPMTAATTSMYEVVEALPPGALVLVSHDYDPGAAGEMIPQAEAVLRHLMERQARLINVSLTPEGARLSQRAVEQVAEEFWYEEGEDYIILGYTPGVEAAPRAVVEGLRSDQWREFVGDGQDISLVVDLAGTPEYLRLWLEQVQAPYGVPMVAGVSATADPYARPYYGSGDQQQLMGLMTGLVGAAEYERQTGREGLALESMDSQSVVHVVMVLLIVVGNVAYFGGRLRGKPSQ